MDYYYRHRNDEWHCGLWWRTFEDWINGSNQHHTTTHTIHYIIEIQMHPKLEACTPHRIISKSETANCWLRWIVNRRLSILSERVKIVNRVEWKFVRYPSYEWMSSILKMFSLHFGAFLAHVRLLHLSFTFLSTMQCRKI